VRKEIGLVESKHYVCFIGRLLKSKEVDIMLRSLRILQRNNKKIGAVIIGDGPHRGQLQDLCLKFGLNDVHFTGFLSAWDISAPYIYACDVLVNPGYVGLSVNHALSFGLPVITQKGGKNGPIHSPEVAFIRPGVTGFFTRNSDIEHLAECVLHALDNIRVMRKECIKYAEEMLTVNNMVEGHIRAIQSVV